MGNSFGDYQPKYFTMKKKESISAGIKNTKNVSEPPITDNVNLINPPILWGIVPNHGKHGQIVKITGGRFGLNASNVKVKFSGVNAEILWIEDIAEGQQIIHAAVPEYIDSGDVKVIVNQQISNPFYFTVDWIAIVEKLTSHPADSLFKAGEKIFFTDPNSQGVFEMPSRIYGPHSLSVLAQGPAVGYATGITRVPRIVNNHLEYDVIITDVHGNHVNKIDSLGNVSVLAGNGSTPTARFKRPYRIAYHMGNYYVTDIDNFEVKKISIDGTVSKFAGSGSKGQFDSPSRKAATFAGLHAICVDADGNVYVTDWHKVRKISPVTGVTTIAGNDQGYLDEFGTNAKFNDPKGMAVAADGYIYIADTYNNKIRRIAPNGKVTTVVNHDLNKPTGIVLSGSTTFNHMAIYVADADGVKGIYFT